MTIEFVDIKDDPEHGKVKASVAAYIAEQRGILHNFKITKEIVEAISRKDAFDLCADLAKYDMQHLPYPAVWLTFCHEDFLSSSNWYDHSQADYKAPRERVTITCCAYDDFKVFGDEKSPTFRNGMGEYIHVDYDDGTQGIINGVDQWVMNPRTGRKLYGKTDQQAKRFIHNVGTACSYAVAALIAALAVKNTVKQTSTNTRIGAKHMKPKYAGPSGVTYLSVTKLAVPPASARQQDPDNPAREGRSPRAHPRRGHMSHYWIGPKVSQKREQRWIAPMWVNADPDFVAKHQYVVK